MWEDPPTRARAGVCDRQSEVPIRPPTLARSPKARSDPSRRLPARRACKRATRKMHWPDALVPPVAAVSGRQLGCARAARRAVASLSVRLRNCGSEWRALVRTTGVRCELSTLGWRESSLSSTASIVIAPLPFSGRRESTTARFRIGQLDRRRAPPSRAEPERATVVTTSITPYSAADRRFGLHIIVSPLSIGK